MRQRLVPLLTTIFMVRIACSAFGQVDVLTQHNDNRRTGANLQETQLTVLSVKQHFGKLWTLFVDGQIVAQPLYVSGLPVTGRAPANAIIVATMHNTIYVYDADKQPTKPQSQDALIWAQWLGTPQPERGDFDSWHTNFPEYGILSTPVIDPARRTMFVVSWHQGGEYRVHALDLTKPVFTGPGFPPPDYRDKVKPAPIITASVPKPGGGTIRLDTTQQKQRAALLLDHGTLYIAFSSNRESDRSLHGWLLAYDAATLQQRAVWNVTPTGYNGGIWQAGSGPAADQAGDVYVMTGNGLFDADHGGQSFGDSVVKLRLHNGALQIVDSFTPCNQAWLDVTCTNNPHCDLDLGSAGPLLVPGNGGTVTRLIGGGKDGTIYVLDPNHLGGFHQPAPVQANCPNPNAVQTIYGPQAQAHGEGVVGNIHGSHVFWRGSDASRVFVWGENDHLRAYTFANGTLTTPPSKSQYRIPDGMPGGMLSISANGDQAGSGIVWAVVTLSGDANSQRGVRAQLLAFDAQNITTDIWRSEPLNASIGPNSVGLFAKFAAPTIANGKVFVSTYGDQENPPGPIQYGGPQPPVNGVPKNFYLAVYGLRP